VPGKELGARRGVQFESCMAPRAGRIWALEGEKCFGYAGPRIRQMTCG